MEEHRLIKDVMRYGRGTAADNIIICIISVLAALFYSYEKYFSFGDKLFALASVVMVLAWMYAGFLSGKDKKIRFPVFAVLFWVFPYLYTLWYAGRGLKNFNKYLAIIYRICKAVKEQSFDWFENRFEMSCLECTGVLLGVTAVMYILGLLLAAFYGKYFEKAVVGGRFRSNEDEGENESVPEIPDDEIVYKGQRYADQSSEDA